MKYLTFSIPSVALWARFCPELRKILKSQRVTSAKCPSKFRDKMSFWIWSATHICEHLYFLAETDAQINRT